MSQSHVPSPASNSLSLLSLSMAAASAPPLTPPTSTSAEPTNTVTAAKLPPQALSINGHTKHRRLSSAGRSRRRLSDARDAATRPSPASLLSTSTSLAALSLSSPTMSNKLSIAQSTNNAQQSLPVTSTQVPIEDTSQVGSVDDKTLATSQAGNGAFNRIGRKRGTVFTCESCSKVYRHPSCLIKHRWEHTPQWQEASKFVLSKHQQVQLLEAAAILSHLSPTSASLPEDRSLWPSFLSGGLVPPPAHISLVNSTMDLLPNDAHTNLSNISTSHPISSSVPVTSTRIGSGHKRSGSTGPRLHRYAIPQNSSGPGEITQVRPGLLGVTTALSSTSDTDPTSHSNASSNSTSNSTSSEPLSPNPGVGSDTKSGSLPVPVPNTGSGHDDALNLLSLRIASVRSTDSWGSPQSYDVSTSPYTFGGWGVTAGPLHAPASNNHTRRNGHTRSFSETSWSLPRSSVRSKSSSSQSPSPSEGKSEDDDPDPVDVGVDGEDSKGSAAGFGTHGRPLAAGAGARYNLRYSPLGYGTMGMPGYGGCKKEDADVLALSVQEETDEEGNCKLSSLRQNVPRTADEWDGMEMEMEMD
ncbi:hypothetical protein EDC04DRAFT_2693991 [Pisolithus marmoratus]|nr:hypothetical protein EDC04DRAFT_2693991 [Pisolithus marmoratus]